MPSSFRCLVPVSREQEILSILNEDESCRTERRTIRPSGLNMRLFCPALQGKILNLYRILKTSNSLPKSPDRESNCSNQLFLDDIYVKIGIEIGFLSPITSRLSLLFLLCSDFGGNLEVLGVLLPSQRFSGTDARKRHLTSHGWRIKCRSHR